MPYFLRFFRGYTSGYRHLNIFGLKYTPMSVGDVYVYGSILC